MVRAWYQLQRTPVVVPNRPWHHPRTRHLPMPLAPELRRQLEARRVVLYMGHIGHDRGLGAVAQAVAELGRPWAFVVMGPDCGALAPLRQRAPSVVHVPYMAPPAHLTVASNAYVGIAKYDYTCLNNVFCAPNKVWEYAGFGIPCLGHDLPGLNLTFAQTRMGECADLDCVASVRAGLEHIQSRYGTYSRNATAAFEAADPAIGIAYALDLATASPSPRDGRLLARRSD